MKPWEFWANAASIFSVFLLVVWVAYHLLTKSANRIFSTFDAAAKTPPHPVEAEIWVQEFSFDAYEVTYWTGGTEGTLVFRDCDDDAKYTVTHPYVIKWAENATQAGGMAS